MLRERQKPNARAEILLKLPALQVKQVKSGCFEAIYEDNACLFKPYSNDQNWKSVLEFLFLKPSQNVICQERTLQDTFKSRLRPYSTHSFAIWGRKTDG